ncbi:replication protein A [Xenorhabdus mauleonii]|uniref:Bacteriophage replication gene A protein (GPA) n=1 Tax=Xenorhabdus mauleonii TaxID=351675 RepID=A0A1I3XIG2_9GAMM|nr:replication endonuclease [Xenorhabdus mauleonii]PHM36191.1 replication protein A [Xenorhabdus mauleonii]SFK19129.1 Bacteriophage replication gene A protein (GPA) [Xenorhabdus mauleonii]
MSELIEHNSDAILSMRRQREDFQPGLPTDATMAERLLWDTNPADHEWRRQFIGVMPDFLAKYFSNRYKKIYTESGRNGRRRANAFLRKTIGENVLPRLNKVFARYQFKHEAAGAIPFPFIEQLERLVTLERKEIRQLAWEVAQFMTESYEEVSAQYVNQPPDDQDEATQRLLMVYQRMAQLAHQTGTVPPYWQQLTQGGKFTVDQLCAGLLRLMSDKWWYGRLKRMRDIRAEHMAIAVGQVQKSASPYVSRNTLREWKEQKRKNWEFLKEFELENELGDRVPLSDMVLGSVANPAVRRCELMVRMRGFEDLADERGFVGEFYTMTAPSKYHAVHSKGGFVENWNGDNPRDTQKYLCNVWARIRATYAREGISVFGFRVVEPHHDGTPHWHMLLFMPPEHVEKMRDIIRHHAMQEDAAELNSDAARKARFHVEPIDKEKGSATGYIAKYISKNIDGYALDDEKDGETGESIKDMAKAVSAWASRWRIRQFQQIGGAPVSVWRELRRLGDARLNIEKLDEVIDAADAGDWAKYTEAQGGPLVARRDLTARLSYERVEGGSPYGEDTQRIQGITSPYLINDPFISTREHRWQIVPKLQADNDTVSGGGLPLSGGTAAPWSSVNNCTGGQRTINEGNNLVEKVVDYAQSIGMNFSRLMAKSLIIGGQINLGEQKFRLWTDGSFIPVETERQKETRREALRQRIINLSEMRKQQ